MAKISVIMSVYNTDQKYLREAIKSILNQSYTDFEFIIIDDASTNINTINVYSEFKDERILLIVNNKNMGLTRSLNKALIIAKGDYIARMDSDDISRHNRLLKELELIESCETISMVCSRYRYIGDTNGLKKSIKYSEDQLKSAMLLYNPICHSTVMIRKKFLDLNNIEYNINYLSAQDYELWTNIIKIGRILQVNEVLVDWRMHKKQISNLKNYQQKGYADTIKYDLLEFYGYNVTTKNKKIHESLVCKKLNKDITFHDVDNWIDYLINDVRKNLINNKIEFKSVIYITYISFVFKSLFNRVITINEVLKLKNFKLSILIRYIFYFIHYKIL